MGDHLTDANLYPKCKNVRMDVGCVSKDYDLASLMEQYKLHSFSLILIKT